MANDMGIHGFLASFRAGISRPNKYRVEFYLPPGVPIGEGEIGVNKDAINRNIRNIQSAFNRTGNVNIKCHTMTWPQRSLMTTQFRQNSAPFNTPYSANYDPITLSFYNDPSLDSRDYFEVWQSAVVNLGTNTMNFYEEYVSDVHMYMIDNYGNDTYKITLYDAWPMNLGIMDTSYSQSNAYTTSTVTLAYRTWSPELNNSTRDVNGDNENR